MKNYTVSPIIVSIVLEFDCHEIINRIDALLRQNARVIFAIEGPCTSGKTTLAGLLQQKYGGNVIPMDDFFLQPKQRTPERLAEPGGNIDYERFLNDVMKPLANGVCFSYRPYDCGLERLGNKKRVEAHPFNMVEGSYSMHPTLQPFYNGKIFLTINKQQQLERIKKRSPHLYGRFVSEWIPLEDVYHSSLNIREKCDFII